jgi:hypothetical protein
MLYVRNGVLILGPCILTVGLTMSPAIYACPHAIHEVRSWYLNIIAITGQGHAAHLSNRILTLQRCFWQSDPIPGSLGE